MTSSNSQNELTFLMVTGSDETIKQSVAAVVQMIHNQFDPKPPGGADIPVRHPSAALPEPVQGEELSPLAGGDHAGAAMSQEPPPRRRRRRTPSAPPPAAPAQAIAARPQKTHADGRKLRKDATLLECSDRPGFALTLQEIATETGHPAQTIRGWMTKAGREWFAIDHLKYRRMVRSQEIA